MNMIDNHETNNKIHSGSHEKYRLKGKPRTEFEKRARASATSAQQCHILRALLDYAGGKPDCWPSNKSLATDTRLSVRQIQRVLGSLARIGVLVIIDDRSIRTQRRVVFIAHPDAAAVLNERGIPAPRGDMSVIPECAPRDDKNDRCRDDKNDRCRDDMGVTRILNLNSESRTLNSFDRSGAPLSLSRDPETNPIRERESVRPDEERGNEFSGIPEDGTFDAMSLAERIAWRFRDDPGADRSWNQFAGIMRDVLSATKPQAWWTIESQESLAFHFARDLGGDELVKEVSSQAAAVLSAAGSWTNAALAFASRDRASLATIGEKLKYLLAIAKKFRDGLQEPEDWVVHVLAVRRKELQENREQAEYEWGVAELMKAFDRHLPGATGFLEWLGTTEYEKCGNRTDEYSLDAGFLEQWPLVMRYVEDDWEGARAVVQAVLDENSRATWDDVFWKLAYWKRVAA